MTRIDSILRCGTGFFGFTMDGLKSSAVQNTPGKSQIPALIARTVCFSCRAVEWCRKVSEDGYFSSIPEGGVSLCFSCTELLSVIR